MIGNRKSNIDFVTKIEKQYKLYSMQPNSKIEDYLNLSREDIRLLTQKDCAEIQYIIAHYALYLKKEENKYAVLYNRVKSALDEIVFKEIGNYTDSPQYMKYEEKVATVCYGNDAAKQLKDAIDDFGSNKEYLSYLSTSVTNIANTINEIKRSKYEPKTG